MKHILTIAFILTLFIAAGCKKEFLDAKPNDKLVVPTGLNDMQQILDNDGYMNGGGKNFGPDPALAGAGADEYYLPDAAYNALPDFGKSLFTWAKTIPYSAGDKNWVRPYRVVFYANTALDGLSSIEPGTSDLATYNNIKGSALFYRSYQFYNLAQIFAPVYDETKAATDLGIPLRLSPDISVPSTRSTLKETYDRIIMDLNTSLSLLPNIPLKTTRPSRPAAFAMLARVYWTMGNYSKALTYCDSSLRINSNLLDFNTISPTLSVPFPTMSSEVLFVASISTGSGNLTGNTSTLRIDSTLTSSYSTNDLRKSLYFKVATDKKYTLKGTLTGSSIPFTGLANDEVYLIQAECYARTGDAASAMKSLNVLLKNRYSASTFTNMTASDPADALNKILDERRKELPMRNLRWIDLRRLNKEGRNITIQRKVLGVTYTLLPNDIRYTWPIPTDVIGLTGMPQNPR